jgi:hypothetical protein
MIFRCIIINIVTMVVSQSFCPFETDGFCKNCTQCPMSIIMAVDCTICLPGTITHTFQITEILRGAGLTG